MRIATGDAFSREPDFLLSIKEQVIGMFRTMPALHQHGTGAPGLTGIHPYKARFELAYGKQETLIRDCALQLLDMGLTLPARVMELIGLERAA